MEETVNVVEEKKTFKERFEDTKTEVKWKAHLACEWCKENKEFIEKIVPVMAPVVIGSIVEIAKIATRQRSINEEKALKDRYIYDRSNGHYYELRRKLKTSEWLQIEQRKQNGESLGWILNDMRLLK